jgi:hypothetical protein
MNAIQLEAQRVGAHYKTGQRLLRAALRFAPVPQLNRSAEKF